MEILTLRFVLTEDDLNNLLVKFVAIPPKVRDLHARVMSESLSLAGVYESILPIPFDTEWRIFVENGKIAARLASIKAVGLRIDFLKGYMLKALSSSSSVLELNEDSLVFDVDRFLEEKSVPIKTNLRSVCCDNGRVVIECGQQGASDA